MRTQNWLVGGLVAVAVVVATIAGVTVAQRSAREANVTGEQVETPSPAEQAAELERMRRGTLIGRWRVTAQWNDGEPSNFDIEFLGDNRFTVSDAAGGQGEGVWEINGSQVNWRYNGEENLNTAYTAPLNAGQMSGTMTADNDWRGTFTMTR